MEYPYNSQLDAFTLYHLTRPTRGTSPSTTQIPTPISALSYSVSSALTTLLLYPLDLLATRQQISPSSQPSLLTTEQSTTSTPFSRPSQSSLSASLLTTLPQNFINQLQELRETIQRIYYDHDEGKGGSLGAFYAGVLPEVLRHGGAWEEIAIGVLAGALTKGICMPVEVVGRKVQALSSSSLLLDSKAKENEVEPVEMAEEAEKSWIKTESSDRSGSGPASFPVPASSKQPRAKADEKRAHLSHWISTEVLKVKTVARDVKRKNGWKGFWVGYEAALLLTLNPSLTFWLYGVMERIRGGKEGANKLGGTFLRAAVAKAIATTITYPLVVGKSRTVVEGSSASSLSSASSIEEKEKMKRKRTPNIFTTIQNIYASEGLGALYAGLPAEILKGFLGHGLTMFLKEIVQGSVMQFYFFLSRLRLRFLQKQAVIMEEGKSKVKGVKDDLENAVSDGQIAAKEGLGKTKELAADVVDYVKQTKSAVANPLQMATVRMGKGREQAISRSEDVVDADAGNGSGLSNAGEMEKAADAFVSRQAGHLLGNAQGMVGKGRVSKEE